MLGSLTLFRGPGLKVFAEVVAQCFLAVSVSVMHDQCRKYSVTCTMHVWRAGGNDRAPLSICLPARANAFIEISRNLTLE